VASKPTAAEEWTQERVCAGDVADLARLPDRKLGADFLADLVFGRLCALPPRGVHIVNAEFPSRSTCRAPTSSSSSACATRASMRRCR
jgi:hypothetical protein